MYKMILVSAALIALIISAGCTSQGTGAAANASGGHIISTTPNASGQQAQAPANATANATVAQNVTQPVINQTSNNSVFQCAYVAPPSGDQQAACKRNASIYIQIKDSDNCTTEYRCMDSVARVTYDLSRISIQDRICPPVITNDVIYAAANSCGAEYDSIEVTVSSTYAYINGSTCAKSISINCTSIGTFVRSTQ